MTGHAVRYAIHVDMDAFFASIEQRANPHLRGKPIIVGGRPGTRSAVASASYEARAFGVRSGMPSHEAGRLCPQAIFVSGNSSHYTHTAKRFYRALGRFSPRVEPASIDEAYLEVATHADVREVGHRIQAHVESELGLTASLGVSDSKYLAKVCSKFSKPRGLTVLLREDVPHVLWPRPVDVLYGVGEKTASRLHGIGCRCVGDVAQLPIRTLEGEFGAYGATLRELAAGNDRWVIATPRESASARSIGHEHTLGRDVYERSRIESLLCGLAEKVARRARRAGLAGHRVVLKLRDPRFNTVTHGRKLVRPVDAAEDVFAVGCSLLDETQFWERGVRLVGLSLQLLVHYDRMRQLCFEFDSHGVRSSPVVDRIRSKHGEHAIGLARTLEAGRRSRHQPRQPSFQAPREETP